MRKLSSMYIHCVFTGVPMYLTHAMYHHHVTRELTSLISMIVTIYIN